MQISPVTPTGELMRYTFTNPTDKLGRPLYTLADLKALQDWVLQREFKRIPGVIDVTGFGGQVKRYEVQPDPERLQRYGITLTQLQNALANSNANVGGDVLFQGPNTLNVRGLGLIGRGVDPVQQVLGWKDPVQAAAFLRAEEQRRLHEIRQIVVASINNVPVRVEDLVEGGPVKSPGDDPGTQGVVIGHQTRLGKVGRTLEKGDAANPVRHDYRVAGSAWQGNCVWSSPCDLGLTIRNKKPPLTVGYITTMVKGGANAWQRIAEGNSPTTVRLRAGHRKPVFGLPTAAVYPRHDPGLAHRGPRASE